MSAGRWIIGAMWLVFVAYWAVAAVGVKRSAARRSWGADIGLRLAVILMMLALMQSRSLRLWLANLQHQASQSIVVGWAGVALCFAGFALAIDARRHLGRNWGMPMSRKEAPDLVTTGPYGHVRHPIYTGLLFAMLGSVLGVSAFWLLPLIAVGGYFIYSARREEAVMLQLFPESYAAYRARTGMLLPPLLRRRQR